MVGQEVTRDARSHGAVFGGRGARGGSASAAGDRVPKKKEAERTKKRDKKKCKRVSPSFLLPLSRTAIYCGLRVTQKLKRAAGIGSYVTVSTLLANEANVRVEQEKMREWIVRVSSK